MFCRHKLSVTLLFTNCHFGLSHCTSHSIFKLRTMNKLQSQISDALLRLLQNYNRRFIHRPSTTHHQLVISSRSSIQPIDSHKPNKSLGNIEKSGFSHYFNCVTFLNSLIFIHSYLFLHICQTSRNSIGSISTNRMEYPQYISSTSPASHTSSSSSHNSQQSDNSASSQSPFPSQHLSPTKHHSSNNTHATNFDSDQTQARSRHHTSEPEISDGTSDSEEGCIKYAKTKRSHQQINRKQNWTPDGKSNHKITAPEHSAHDVTKSRRDLYLNMQDEYDRKKIEYEAVNGRSTPYPRARPPNLLPMYESPPCTPSRKKQRTRKTR